jgi:hypothetical protein
MEFAPQIAEAPSLNEKRGWWKKPILTSLAEALRPPPPPSSASCSVRLFLYEARGCKCHLQGTTPVRDHGCTTRRKRIWLYLTTAVCLKCLDRAIKEMNIPNSRKKNIHRKLYLHNLQNLVSQWRYLVRQEPTTEAIGRTRGR